MPTVDDDFYYDKLKKKIMEDLGFQTQHYGDKHLKRRFMVRMRAVRAQTYREYIECLKTDSEEYPKLLNTLTVNVTEWFRNPEVYKILKERIIPDMVNTNKAQNRRFLRVWSVGCSDGKEPYSLAMCIKDVLEGEGADGLAVTIFAWDIDGEMLKKARFGLYEPKDMKGLEKSHIEKYFVKEDNGYRIIPEIRSMVKFEKKDLNTDKKRTGIDLILCRNVVIYLTPDRKSSLYVELYHCLRAGGYFVMGKSETLLGEARRLFKPTDNINRIYQKSGD